MRLLLITLCVFAVPIKQFDPGEEAAIKAVKKLGGTVKENGTVVELAYPDVTDASLKELGPLKRLTSLSLFNTKVTDTGLKELAGFKRLTHLRLRDSEVTDAGLKELVPLKGLTHLDLGATNVTDSGLKELAALKGLTQLDLTCHASNGFRAEGAGHLHGPDRTQPRYHMRIRSRAERTDPTQGVNQTQT